MKQRIITGGLLAVILGLLVYFGEGKFEFLFSGTCVLLATIAAYEFTRMSLVGRRFKWFDYLPILLTAAFATLSVIYFDGVVYFIYVFIFILVIMLIYALVFVINQDFTRADFGNHILTIFYTSLGFIAFAYLRKESLNLIVYIFIVSMITDVFAYFIGIKFGKHKLAKIISPKKSVEGAVGGLVFGALAATLFAYYLQIFDFGLFYIILLSILLSVISQIGDLIASKFKREVNIKDYSNIFPGHGGVLDRFDSSMFAAIFLMLALIIT